MYMRVKMKSKVLYRLYGLFRVLQKLLPMTIAIIGSQTSTHHITQKPWRTRPSQQPPQGP